MKETCSIGILAIGILLSPFLAADDSTESARKINLMCSKFKGFSLTGGDGNVGSVDDKYSFQVIQFSLPMPEDVASLMRLKATAEWKGQNTRVDYMTLIHGFSPSPNVLVMNYSSSHPQVQRNYSLYLDEKRGFFASFTEAQTELFTGKFETRTYMGKCVDLGAS